MKTIKVGGMHCQSCVKRISEALNKEGIKYEISLENGTVSIDGCDGCLKTAKQVIYDLGFNVD